MIVFRDVLDNRDIAAVADLAQQIWTEHFSPIIGVPQVEYMLKEFQSARAIERYLAQGYKYYLVDLDGLPIGYLGLLATDDKSELFLSKLYLLSRFRGRGFGRQMMDFVKEFARARSLKKISLNTNKKNLDTIRFYEKVGFADRFSDVTDLGHGFVADDWRMEMAVGPC